MQFTVVAHLKRLMREEKKEEGKGKEETLATIL